MERRRIDMRKTNKKKSHKEFVNELKEKNPILELLDNIKLQKIKLNVNVLFVILIGWRHQTSYYLVEVVQFVGKRSVGLVKELSKKILSIG